MTRAFVIKMLGLFFILGVTGASVSGCNTVEGVGTGVAKDAKAVKKKL
jgi:predicted small secreted protein